MSIPFERQFHQWLEENSQSQSELVLGIGDDAAVFNTPTGCYWVATTDSLADGAHFLTAEHALEQIGHKALAVSLSDIAAMGGTPRLALVNLVLPLDMTLDDARRLQSGAARLASATGVAIIGGDTNRWPGQLVVSTTLLGTVPIGRQWEMSRIQIGDRLLVSGSLGGSILGHHLDFTPRNELAQYLQENSTIHAATDLSDSLTLDLHAMLQKSGRGAVLYESAIPIADDARQLSESSGQTPLHHALCDGEDFELLLAVSPEVAKKLSVDPNLPGRLFTIGVAVEEPGLWIEDRDGSRRPLTPEGYSH